MSAGQEAHLLWRDLDRFLSRGNGRKERPPKRLSIQPTNTDPHYMIEQEPASQSDVSRHLVDPTYGVESYGEGSYDVYCGHELTADMLKPDF